MSSHHSCKSSYRCNFFGSLKHVQSHPLCTLLECFDCINWMHDCYPECSCKCTSSSHLTTWQLPGLNYCCRLGTFAFDLDPQYCPKNQLNNLVKIFHVVATFSGWSFEFRVVIDGFEKRFQSNRMSVTRRVTKCSWSMLNATHYRYKSFLQDTPVLVLDNTSPSEHCIQKWLRILSIFLLKELVTWSKNFTHHHHLCCCNSQVSMMVWYWIIYFLHNEIDF